MENFLESWDTHYTNEMEGIHNKADEYAREGTEYYFGDDTTSPEAVAHFNRVYLQSKRTRGKGH